MPIVASSLSWVSLERSDDFADVLQSDLADRLSSNQWVNMVGQRASETGQRFCNQFGGFVLEPLLGCILEGTGLVETLRLNFCSLGFQRGNGVGDIPFSRPGNLASLL